MSEHFEGKRIKAVRKKRQLSQEEFANILHITRSYLSELETDRRQTQPYIQERILEMERVDKLNEINTPAASGLLINSTPPNARILGPMEKVFPKRVPVVSWATAGRGGNFGDLAEQIDEYVDSDCTDPNSYALIIEGDSMVPQILPGDRVIFMPNIEPRNGDIVVARVQATGEVFLKLFHIAGKHGELVRLTSFNQAYPALEFKRSEFRFIHPMHSMFRRWRR